MYKLIADSGSTKTDWCLAAGGQSIARYSTQGINPFQQNEENIREIIVNELLPQINDMNAVDEVYFYGAGCRGDMIQTMETLLKDTINGVSVVEVNGDLLAAARALCGRNAGVACILGTGTNSCLYDGERIVANVPPLGYILGDEGSGAVLGRNLVNALYKGRMPVRLVEMFEEETGLTLPTIIYKVYKEPLANRLLASFSLFVSRHIDEYDELRNLVIDNFKAFFRNNIRRYESFLLAHQNLTEVNAIGSMACYYESELRTAASIEGFKIGTVKRSPMEGLIKFHG